MYLTHLECTECGRREDWRQLATFCGPCRAPWQACYDFDAVRRAVDPSTMARRRGGLWRFREVLPLPTRSEPTTLGEGGTPLLSLSRLGKSLGLPRLYLKDEALNPTGSFKARGMSVAVSMAHELGARQLAVPSAGNAGGALAAYGARAGVEVFVAMPGDVPAANRVEAEVCGAHITLCPGTIADCGRWIAAGAQREGWFDLSTLKEPYRVEGKKTMGYELVGDFHGDLPEVILYPTGGGTGLVGMAKAFDEMQALGWLDGVELPRFVAVQAEGCAPIVDAYRAGADRAEPPRDPQTVASGLRVPSPIGDRWMLRALRRSGGHAIAVSDAELLAGSRRLAASEGVFPAPEAGALVAAAARLRQSGEITAEDRVVLFSTGTGLKYLECFE